LCLNRSSRISKKRLRFRVTWIEIEDFEQDDFSGLLIFLPASAAFLRILQQSTRIDKIAFNARLNRGIQRLCFAVARIGGEYLSNQTDAFLRPFLFVGGLGLRH